ncbi:MAG: anthranilate phosphoribosyltransferase [Planctomycetota bacterium]
MPAPLAAAIDSLLSGRALSFDQAQEVMRQVMAGTVPPPALAGFLIALRAKGETVDEIAGLASAMRAAATRVDAPEGAIDTCGTGGDRSGSFNISTAVALVAAAAGASVVKHGNRAVSGKTGSADVLEQLGVRADLPAAAAARCLRECRICFCFAPHYHPGMKHAMPARLDLGVRTVFNLLGPLSNPGHVRRQIVGVSNPALTATIAEVLLRLNHMHAWVVTGPDGFDEIALSGPTTVYEVLNGAVKRFTIDARDLGVEPADVGRLRADTPEQSAEIIRAVLAGHPGPARDVVAVNAGAALLVTGLAADLRDGIDRARRAIDSGAARKTLTAFACLSQELGATRP